MTNEALRQRLILRRRELLHRYRDELARVEEELTTTASERSPSQLGTDMRAIVAVVAALDRLAFGRYGKCTECGESIGAARLEALPEVATCLSCATSAAPRAHGSAPRL